MKRSLIQQLILYRYRYAVAYVLFFGLLILLLTTQLTSVPEGINAAEKKSVVESASVALQADTRVIDLPYHILQKLSVKYIGLNEYGIKLPSIILGLLSGLGIILLLRRWFSHNVALIAALFIVTNVLFLASARTGTPEIMLIFLPTFILLITTLITQNARGQFFWRTSLGALIAVSLYTPLSLYVILSCLIAGLLHPHTRYVIRRYGGRQLVGSLFLLIPLTFPLAVGIWKNPKIVPELLGLPASYPDTATFTAGLFDVATRLGSITEPYIGEYVQPAFSIVSLALIGLGLLRAFMDFHAARTYALLIWIAIISPVVVITQDYLPILFLPATLLIAIGLQTLIKEWYALFPRNPYARLVGLIPLLLLICSVIYINYTNYFYGLRYSPETAKVYSSELHSINDILTTEDINRSSVTVVSSPEDVPFYKLLSAPKTSIQVVSSAGFTLNESKGTYIINASEPVDGRPKELIRLSVNSREHDALLWRTYVRW